MEQSPLALKETVELHMPDFVKECAKEGDRMAKKAHTRYERILGKIEKGIDFLRNVTGAASVRRNGACTAVTWRAWRRSS